MQQGAWVFAIGISVLFLANFVWTWVQGKRQNPVKLALLGTSIAFWWYCNNGVTNILAGIALFEVFHDVQYLSLVWIYNRNRVEKDSSIGGFMRFVFRRSGSLIGLYVGLVFAYGSLGYLSSHMGIETVKRILTGVVAASGLLHFYYDGFIWKVREKSTRQSLGLSGGAAEATSSGFFPGWLSHSSKWALAFVLPLGAMWFGQMRGTVPEIDRWAWVITDVPTGRVSITITAPPCRKRVGSTKQPNNTTPRCDSIRPTPRSTSTSPDFWPTKESLMPRKHIFRKRCGSNRTTPSCIPPTPICWSEWAAAMKRKLNIKTRFALNPRSARILYNYGAFLDKRGQLNEAIAQYRARFAR